MSLPLDITLHPATLDAVGAKAARLERLRSQGRDLPPGVSESQFLHEHYRTPAEVAQAVIEQVLQPRPDALCLDPCAGDGALVRALLDWGCPRVDACEIDRAWAGELRRQPLRLLACPADFLAWAPDAVCRYDLVIANPPFSLFVPFADAALRLLAPGGRLALLGRLAVLGTQGRADWWRRRPADTWVIPWRVQFVDNDSSPSEEHAWYVWTQGRRAAGRVDWLRSARELAQPSLALEGAE